jgi:hypothetical protein
MAYWIIRTPAEVVKTQVQTGQFSSVREALAETLRFTPNISSVCNMAEVDDDSIDDREDLELRGLSAVKNSEQQLAGIGALWRRYPVMLSLDIPFQLINFVLYGVLSEAVFGEGGGLHWEQNVWTRLFCGMVCGMVAAGLTCPLDVCKTRIISREKQQKLQENPKKDLHQRLLSMGVQVGDGFVLDEDRPVPSDSTTTADGIEGTHHEQSTPARSTSNTNSTLQPFTNGNVLVEMVHILRTEGVQTLFLGLGQRLVYTGLANGIRLAAYGTSRMDLMMRSLDRL